MADQGKMIEGQSSRTLPRTSIDEVRIVSVSGLVPASAESSVLTISVCAAGTHESSDSRQGSEFTGLT